MIGVASFIDKASFRETVGMIALLFGIINILPLPIVNGGQAIVELANGRINSRWLGRWLLASLAIFGAFVVLLVFWGLARPRH
jgi:hypothetical protein